MPPLWIACWDFVVERLDGGRLTSRGSASDPSHGRRNISTSSHTGSHRGGTRSTANPTEIPVDSEAADPPVRIYTEDVRDPPTALLGGGKVVGNRSARLRGGVTYSDCEEVRVCSGVPVGHFWVWW